jgi:hypothetical protein
MRLAKATLARNAATGRAERAARPASTDSAFSGTPKVLVPAQPFAIDAEGKREAAASLRFPSQPVRILLNDRQGVQRSVSLEPVVFGAQNILERSAQKHPAVRDAEGIW